MSTDLAHPIAQRLGALRDGNEGALVLFVTAGDPALAELPAILECLQDAGADVIEVGVPFSDPIADGPTIQASSQSALDRGVNPQAVLETLGQVRLDVPIVLMGYYNSVLCRGLEAFAAQAAQAGVAGTIISDLTPEESDGWVAASRGAGLANVFLAAPTSTDARLDAVCSRSTGFVYAVSRTGVTGAANVVPQGVGEMVGRIRARTQTPVCVGFGISEPEHVRRVCADADGAVVGSWLVDLLAAQWQGGRGAGAVREAVAALKAATRR